MTVDPSTVVYCYVGAGGAAGGARDGPYSSGSSGGAGGYSGVLNTAQNAWHVLSYGGQGGGVSGTEGVSAAGGTGGVGTVFVAGIAGGAASYQFISGGKNNPDYAAQEGGAGAPGQRIYYPGNTAIKRDIWQTTSGWHAAGKGSYNYPSSQATGVTAPSVASSDCGGGGGGGGVNVADNGGGMTPGAGGNGYCLICW